MLAVCNTEKNVFIFYYEVKGVLLKLNFCFILFGDCLHFLYFSVFNSFYQLKLMSIQLSLIFTPYSKQFCLQFCVVCVYICTGPLWNYKDFEPKTLLRLYLFSCDPVCDVIVTL